MHPKQDVEDCPKLSTNSQGKWLPEEKTYIYVLELLAVYFALKGLVY